MQVGGDERVLLHCFVHRSIRTISEAGRQALTNSLSHADLRKGRHVAGRERRVSNILPPFLTAIASW